EPDVTMNPVLLKPTGERTSQVIVFGRPVGVMTAREYHDAKPQLLEQVLSALGDLRSRYDVVLCEGAGSPAEINLLDHDIVNLRIAHEAQIPAVLVGDIELGGVFASLYGTVALLPDGLRAAPRPDGDPHARRPAVDSGTDARRRGFARAAGPPPGRAPGRSRRARR